MFGAIRAPAFEGLAGNVGDDLEVLVQMQDGQASKFGRRRNDEIGNRRARC